MARGKKSKSTVGTKQQPSKPDKQTQDDLPKGKTQPVETKKNRYAFYDYLFVAVFFVVFMYVQKYIALWILGSGDSQVEKLSLDFFFDTMWKGFVVVVLLVWLHDFFFPHGEAEDTT